MKIVALSMFLCGTMLMTVAALYAASLSAEFKASQIPLQVRICYLRMRKCRSSGLILLCTHLRSTFLISEPRVKFFSNKIQGVASGLFGGQSKINMDQIRFDLGGCIYAAFCISFLEMASSVAIWHWRGFDFARQIERKEEKDKDQEYQSRLEKLLEETGGMKDSFGKELRHYG